MNNPFKPQNVRISNYNPESIERKKIENIGMNLNGVRNTSKNYQEKFQGQKTFKDVVKLPKSYGDVLPKGQSYGSVLKKRDDSYASHLPQRNGYNGFKNN